MKKLVIICPECSTEQYDTYYDTYVEATPGFFNFLLPNKYKTLKCSKGHKIKFDEGRMATKECSHCGNIVVYDLLQGEDALCPVCRIKINTEEDKFKLTRIPCTECGCSLSVEKGEKHIDCPICGKKEIDVEKQIKREEISKSGLASVIKYEGNNNTFVWKHPVEDFNIGSQLIVHESQEAIFFRNGEALDSFRAGRYTLETESIPLINNLYNNVLEPKAVFHSEVYFVNLTTQMGIKWGTDSKVRFLEPLTGIPFDIGASGEFNLRVSNSRKLVMKLVGTEGGLNRDALLSTELCPGGEASYMGVSENADGSVGVAVGVVVGKSVSKSVGGYFRSMIMTRVKTHLAKTIKESKINILEIDEHLDSLSSALCARINEGLAEYGLTMPEFFVTTVVTPDDDVNFRKLKQQHADLYLRVRDEENIKKVREAEAERRTVEERTKAQMKIIEAQGEAEAYRLKAEAEAKEMQMKGYTYAQETQRKIGLEAVQGGIIKESGGAGGGSGLGDIVGLGVGLGAIGSVIGLAKDAISPIADVSSDVGKTVGVMTAGVTSLTQGDVADSWDCPCGEKAVKGNFCNNCGTRRPELPKPWTCSKCGANNDKGLFCSDCGEKKPIALTWDCSCGEKSIKGNFCSNCGKKREELKDD